MGNPPFGAAAARDTARISIHYSRASWIDGRAEDQLTQVAAWEGISAIAAFPDLHPGRHGPVGVAVQADRIYPQLLGPDIGCGMALYALDLHRRKLKLDKAACRLRILQQGADPVEAAAALAAAGLGGILSPHGLGTIGGGNHFCELQSVEEIFPPPAAQACGLSVGQVCLLVHSGSRNLGAGLFSGLKGRWEDGYCAGSAAAQDYLALHDRAVIWARINRHLVARTASRALRADLALICDAPHNNVEAYRGGWLHRKGAARPDRGLAPLAGSREALSYLLSCPALPEQALGSLSHGAGRRHDRASMHGRIRKTRSEIAALARTRFGGHVVCEDRDLLIEEAGMAYKDVRQVVADLEAFGIARPIASLAPLVTFKTARQEAW